MKKIIYKSIYLLTIVSLGYLAVLACVQAFVWLREWSTYLIDTL